MGTAGTRFGPKVLAQRRPVTWPFACALVTFACGLAMLAAALHALTDRASTSVSMMLLGGLLVAVVGKVAAAVLWLVKPTARHQVLVEADAGRLVVGGATMRTSGAVAQAVRDGTWRVDAYEGTSRTPAVFVVSSSDEANALVQALTPAVADGPMTFRLPFYQSRIGTWISVMVIAAGFTRLRLFGSHSAWTWALDGVVIACTVLLVTPVRLTVGRDAIGFAWLLFRKYVPLADVAEASVKQGKLALRLRSGSTLLLGDREMGMGRTGPRSAGAAAHVVNAFASPSEVDDAEALVAQGDRSRSVWRDALRALGAPGYRESTLTDQRLWSLLEHPRASASARIGAAFLLAEGLDGEGKLRLQRFALGCVDPGLRHELDVVQTTGSLAA